MNIKHIDKLKGSNNFNNRGLSVGNEFKSVINSTLSEKNKEVKISAHARNRFEERKIDFNKKDLKKIKEAIDGLSRKGARESLMLYKDMGLIASVDNRTIITALDMNEDIQYVTNIDSVVMIKD